MRFGLLGPLSLRTPDGLPIQLARRKERQLSAILLLRANRFVGVDELLQLLWDGERVPASAQANLQTYVAHCRRAIGDNRCGIETGERSYRLRADPGEIDHTAFEGLVAQGFQASAADDPATAARLFDEALGLWRGEAVAEGLGLPVDLQPEVNRLTELRLSAQAECLAARLDLGQAREVAAELVPLIGKQPLRERLWELLMLARFRDGRQADALAAFEEARALLDEELGVLPGAGLRELHQRILQADPGLSGAPDPVPSAGTPVPRQLPREATAFTGRRAEADRVLAELSRPGSPVVVIDGLGGVGKTSLAVHAAHRLASHFPDGQLYLDLHGYSDAAPMRPIEALTRLLRALGVNSDQIPDDDAEATGLLRTRLSGRRVLLVLDNAGSVDQVVPLLPGCPGSAALVTSRDRLGSVIARHGGVRLPLAELAPADAETLLTEIAGADRITADRPGAAELARLCGHLPLALRVAAANLALHPTWSVEYYLGLLREGSLAALTVDGDAGVRATLHLSYTRLDPAAGRLFRLLGALVGPDVSADAAAVLAGSAGVRTLLDRLCAANLLQEPSPHRYSMHDLVQEYARELSDDDAESASAHERLAGWYLTVAAAAVRTAYPNTQRLPDAAELADRSPRGFADRPAAQAWLDAELQNLVALVLDAAERGSRSLAWRLGDVLRCHFLPRTPMLEWRAVALASLAAAGRAADRWGQTSACLSLAGVARRQTRYAEAVEFLHRTIDLAAEIGWLDCQAAAYNNLGVVHLELTEPQESSAALRAAAELFRRLGDVAGEGLALGNLGGPYQDLGRLRESIELARRELAVESKTGQTSNALSNMASSHRMLGEYDLALAEAREALDRAYAGGNNWTIPTVLEVLACIHRDLGDLATALELARQAVTIAADHGFGRTGAESRVTLGTILALRGEYAAAAEEHERVLALLDGPHSIRVRLLAVVGLAEAYRGLGRYAEARSRAEEALADTRRHQLRVVEADAAEVLARIHADLGDPAAAEYRRLQAEICAETGYRILS
ncbi:DNA-binding SARP family transcriptional activator [Hamadaea flava]|uniref:BTAD domain-containing putative transcriptional regulator n=1 Tax=Hamadaea flava TaxID=1742688 RepID=A0ABV8LHF6_9ACTN|nr:BTAD domain-containing putative transcriptional regulator [Hamadaea flava]MCP2325471.1 DNA-binding SARP family transcriptional activator [Hamadaea flava]